MIEAKASKISCAVSPRFFNKSCGVIEKALNSSPSNREPIASLIMVETILFCMMSVCDLKESQNNGPLYRVPFGNCHECSSPLFTRPSFIHSRVRIQFTPRLFFGLRRQVVKASLFRLRPNTFRVYCAPSTPCWALWPGYAPFGMRSDRG